MDEFFQSCESSEAMTFRFTSKLPKMGAAKWVQLYAQICGVPKAVKDRYTAVTLLCQVIRNRIEINLPETQSGIRNVGGLNKQHGVALLGRYVSLAVGCPSHREIGGSVGRCPFVVVNGGERVASTRPRLERDFALLEFLRSSTCYRPSTC